MIDAAFDEIVSTLDKKKGMLIYILKIIDIMDSQVLRLSKYMNRVIFVMLTLKSSRIGSLCMNSCQSRHHLRHRPLPLQTCVCLLAEVTFESPLWLLWDNSLTCTIWSL